MNEDVILEKISNIQDDINLILKKLEEYDKLRDRISRMEAFFKGLTYLCGTLFILGSYIYNQDKNDRINTDIKHDQALQIWRDDKQFLTDRILKLEYNQDKK